MKKIIAVIFVLCMLYTAACGSAPASGQSEAAPAETPSVTVVEPGETPAGSQEPVPSEAPAPSPEVEEEPTEEEDGQNPVMNFVGPYSSEICSILIEAEGSKKARASITMSGSTSELIEWSMSGVFDTESLSFEYTNGIKTKYVYGSDGVISSNETVYNDGTGTIAFTEDGKLSWIDNNEHTADGVLFNFVPDTFTQWDLS